MLFQFPYMAVSFVYSCVVLMNGTDDETKAVDMSRYYEIMKPGDVFTDVITGKKVTIGETMDFAPRAVYVLE